ncbi:MAG: hypothetical protein GC191_09305 [Azospirillum sp.]|nr:hypothetical protein [Azospirillum sp.]
MTIIDDRTANYSLKKPNAANLLSDDVARLRDLCDQIDSALAALAALVADAELSAIAGLASAADKVPYYTGAGTAALATFTSAARTLIAASDAAAQRAALGLGIGTNVQAYDAELSAIAGLASAADKVPYFTGAGTAALTTFTSAARTLVAAADAAAQRAALGLGSAALSTTADFLASTLSGTAGEAIDVSGGPVLVYADAANQRGGGAGRWWKTDADASGPVRISPTLGLAVSSAAGAGNAVSVAVAGAVSGFSGLTAGAPCWAADTAGALTQVEPAAPGTGTQRAVARIGFALSSTTIILGPDRLVYEARDSALAVDGTVTVEHHTDAGGRERQPLSYVLVPSAFADVTGVATVSTSGVIYSGNAANTVDGNTATGTVWNISRNAAVGSAALWKADFGSGVTKEITQVSVYEGTQAAQANLPQWKLQYSSDNASWYDACTVSISTSSAYYTQSFSSVGSYRYWRLVPSQNGSDSTGFGVTEVRLFVPVPARDEPLPVRSASVSAAATDCVTCRYDDGTGTNGDTKTTFGNRSGAVRNLLLAVAF